jgi:uncharacterized membrane protein (DUF373 family)
MLAHDTPDSIIADITQSFGHRPTIPARVTLSLNAFLNKLPNRSGVHRSGFRADFRPVSSHFVLNANIRMDICKRELFRFCHKLMKSRKIFGILSSEWNAMSFYGQFEQIITWILTISIAVIITIALLRLIVTIFQLLVIGALNPLNHQEFELIAMEFNHSILQTMERLHRIIQVKTVILISILALARKFIVLNIEVTPALTTVALGFAVIALGVVYWLLRERNDRSVPETKANPKD